MTTIDDVLHPDSLSPNSVILGPDQKITVAHLKAAIENLPDDCEVVLSPLRDTSGGASNLGFEIEAVVTNAVDHVDATATIVGILFDNFRGFDIDERTQS